LLLGISFRPISVNIQHPYVYIYAGGAFSPFTCRGRHAMRAPAQAACRQPVQLNAPLISIADSKESLCNNNNNNQFDGPLSRSTRVNQYQKKHLLTHTLPLWQFTTCIIIYQYVNMFTTHGPIS